MKILIAEDELVTRKLLEQSMKKWGHEATSVADGEKAWQELQREAPPRLAIIDWMMPELTGVELCRRIRANPNLKSLYVILLTSRTGTENIVEGLAAGANDYVVKPFEPNELSARISVGIRVIQLQDELATRVAELETALNNVKQLQGLLPICCYCKKIRDDRNYWHQVETYISHHSKARFSHGFCPECYEKHLKPELDAIEQAQNKSAG